jgi:hypothetical protein
MRPRSLDTNKMCGRSLSRPFQARTLSLQAQSASRSALVGAALRTWTCHAACRRVRARRLTHKGSDGNALCDAWRQWEMVRPEMRVAVRLKKPATGFPARACIFDVEIMQVICPTGQELF